MCKIAGIPFLLWWIGSAAIFLTFKMRFANFLCINDAITSLRTKKNKDSGLDAIEVSPFTAFISQAAGNLGLGNIAGAAFAVHFGGPGVILWIIVSIFFCGIIKFCEITLGHMYRYVDSKNIVNGGPFYYIDAYFNEKNLKKIGKFVSCVVALLLAIVPMTWSAFQTNQIVRIMIQGSSGDNIVSLGMVALTLAIIVIVGIVLLGGITRIGKVANMLIPCMALGYLIMSGCVIVYHIDNLLNALQLVWHGAFESRGIKGGMCAVVVIAVQRMIFATEAGVATAAIVHATSSIDKSVRQGLIGLLDCALVAICICIGCFSIVISGIDYKSGELMGIMLIDSVFSNVYGPFHYILSCVVFLFGFTTIVANGYCVQQSFGFIYGTKHSKLYIGLYMIVAGVMSLYNARNVLIIVDALILLILIPNIFSLYALSGDVRRELDDYLRLKKRK